MSERTAKVPSKSPKSFGKGGDSRDRSESRKRRKTHTVYFMLVGIERVVVKINYKNGGGGKKDIIGRYSYTCVYNRTGEMC